VTPRILLPLAALGAGGLCLWALFALGRTREPIAPDSAADVAADGASGAELRPGAPKDAIRVAPELAPIEAESAAALRARVAGIPPNPPDTLVAVHGRVVDALSGEPVKDMTLCLLSRRPRTCLVRTDAEGRFATAAELSNGVVSAAHVPDAESARFSSRWAIEPTSFLAAAPGTPGEGREIVLVARAPERELAVDVRLPDGGAAAGASVSLTWGHRDPPGRFLAEGRAYEETDGYGRARFALFGSDSWERSFRIEAEHKGTLASDVLSLDPPLGRSTPVLGLHPGGLLRVRAANDEGRPVAGVSLWVETPDDTGTVRGKAGETDARGECVFTALRPGCYSVSAIHPSTGTELRREVDLGRGAQEVVDLRLSLAGLRLRLAGTVVDEFGYPLPGVSVRAQAAGEPSVSLTTGEGGRFEFWGRACDGVLFTTGGGFLDDRYDPEIMSVPCGSAGLTVRRLARLETRSWPFALVDRETGEAVTTASVTLYHGDPHKPCPALQSFTASSGIVQVAFKQRDDLAFAVDAPGYVREEGPLADLLAAAGKTGLLRVELERGFDRRLEIRDRITRSGIARALVSSGGVVLGRADERGSVRLRGDTWPASLRVESPGYAPATWDPAAAGFPGDVIWLEPLHSGN
jgi:hypothetical protein